MAGLLTLYEQAMRAATPLLQWLLRRRVARGKEDRARLHERMGRASLPRPDGKLVWVHAASVGEAQSALILVNAVLNVVPGAAVLVTSGTVTSASLMQMRLPPRAFHQFMPLDHPGWVTSFLDHWRPDFALWMESELWPNMLAALRRRHVPAVLVNARLSEKSFRNWRYAKGEAATLLRAFSLILTQTNNDAENFRRLGANGVIPCDNIKYSADPLPVDPLALSTLRLSLAERPRWVYASTHEGEEDLACRLHIRLRETLPDLLTVIVPRHPERRDDIADTCFKNGLKFRLRGMQAALPTNDDDVYIADTMGELGLFYSLCDVAMIGRSFSDDGGGGHNPVEAAQLGCAVLTGPNNQYQRPIYDDMAEAGAVIEVATEDELYEALLRLLTDPTSLEARRERGAEFAAAKVHVIDAVMDHISPLLIGAETRHAA